MGKEGVSISESVLRVNNVVDVWVFGYAFLTGSVGLAVLSVGSFLASHKIEEKVAERRKSGKFVI